MSEEPHKRFIIMRTLGKGSFGKVKLALHTASGEKVAIKVLEKAMIKKEDDLMRIRREIDILSKVRHPNIIQLYEVIETENYFFFIMEFAEEGELSEYIKSRKRLSEEEACRFFQQLVQAVRYFHKLGCAHRDIKPSNILVDWRGSIKLIDFGLGNLYSSEEKLKTACGSPCYAAPEVRVAEQIIAGESYNPLLVDIWSSGITLFNMLCGELPFEEESKSTLYEKILACKFSVPKYLSPSAVDLLKKLLVRDPRKRLNVEGILNHEWMARYRPKDPTTLASDSYSKLDPDTAAIVAQKLTTDLQILKRMLSDNQHNDTTTL